MGARQNILILSAGRRVELVQAFQTELAKRIPDAAVYAADMRPDLSSACQVADNAFILPRATDDNYIPSIEHLCAAQNIGLVIPTIDTELLILAQHADRLAEAGTTLVISDTALITQCRDKRLTADLFQRINIDTPVIYERGAIRFPCFAKPYDGSSGIGAQQVNSIVNLPWMPILTKPAYCDLWCPVCD
jgi:carbamoyl-phosphate synthase large subunit